MGLDQYYTKPNIAAECVDLLKSHFELSKYFIIEPSAGTGVFLDIAPIEMAFDLAPRHPNIIKKDFLETNIGIQERDILFLGNPPFGKNASTALKFFNHAATHASVIAFILPRTFRKASMVNRLNKSFHLLEEIILPEYSFIHEQEQYDVPCVFQIWERRDYVRKQIKVQTKHPDFEFTTADKADFAIQRVGVNAGRIKHDLTVSSQSHYFIKGDVLPRMKKIDFTKVKYDTAGNPSIAKSEIIQLYDGLTD